MSLHKRTGSVLNPYGLLSISLGAALLLAASACQFDTSDHNDETIEPPAINQEASVLDLTPPSDPVPEPPLKEEEPTGSNTADIPVNNDDTIVDDILKEDSSQEEKPVFDFTQPVPESEPVEDSWFSDAIFIGNSRTQGFQMYTGLQAMGYYAQRGTSVSSVFSKADMKIGGEEKTIMEAVLNQNGYTKVYIMLGINELGWPSAEKFTDSYGKIIDALRKKDPEVQIYIQSILPVTKTRSLEDPVYNNENILAFNAGLRLLAAEKQCYYVDVANGLSDSEGCLPPGSASDGIHMKANWCKAWLEYLKTHTVQE